ncbi:hypothetical protein LA080_008025 [Diaporthe eres]|nr:hypothetical protein LA080_008025 [Diaporthe eres]
MWNPTYGTRKCACIPILSTVRRGSACLGGLPDHPVAAPRSSSSTATEGQTEGHSKGIMLDASAGSTRLPTRTSAILLALSPTRSSGCLAVAAGKSCRAGQSDGQSVGQPVSVGTFGESRDTRTS